MTMHDMARMIGTKYQLARLELWGNEKDGFDCNNAFNCGVIDAQDFKTADAMLLYIRKQLHGLSFAKHDSDSRGYMRGNYKPYWEFGDYGSESFIPVCYRGTEVANLTVMKHTEYNADIADRKANYPHLLA